MIHGYARVSTSGQSLDSQLDALGFCDQVHQESASTRGDLPVLEALIDRLQAGDTLAVTRLDRLGRSLIGVVGLVQGLQARNVALKVLAGDIDTGTANGRFQLAVFAAFSELERDLIRERTIAGMKAAQAKGKKLGRPVALPTDKMEAAKKLVASGMAHNQVAKSLGVSRSSIYRAFPAGPDAAQTDLFGEK